MNGRLQIGSLLLGGSVLLFGAGTLLVCALLFAVGVEITGWNLALGAVVAAGGLAYGVRSQVEGARQQLVVFVSVLLVLGGLVVTSALLGGAFYDVSYDGQGYHLDAVIKLHDGWNPVWQPETGNVWNDHYAKGAEILAAALFKVTGHVEQGKAWNLLLLVASWLVAFSALLLWDRQVWRALLASLVLAWNPVVLNQTMSFYLDGQLGALLLALLGLGSLYAVRGQRFVLLLIGAVLLLIVNIKFTGVVYAAVLCGGAVVLLILAGRRRWSGRLLQVTALSFVVGVLLVGWNPYLLNTVEKGHPFYPVAGAEKLDIMAQQVPGNLIDLPPWKRLLYSLFSRSENVLATQNATLKQLFTWDEQEVATFKGPDPRIGGFGPLFGGALLFGVVALGLACFLVPRRQALLLAASAGVLLLSVLINPEAWWARFAPQLWLFPALVAAYGLVISRQRALQVVSLALLLVLVGNSWLTSQEYFTKQREFTVLVEQQLSALQVESQAEPIPVLLGTKSHARRFLEHGVRYLVVRKLDCAGKTQLPSSVTFVCTPAFLKETAGK